MNCKMVLMTVLALCIGALADAPRSVHPAYGPTLRERAWMWGHDTGAFDGPGNSYNIPVSEPVTMAESIRRMGVPNVCVVRWKSPAEDDAYLAQFKSVSRIGWLVASAYSQPVMNKYLTEGAINMLEKLPNLTVLELDDFFRLDMPTGIVEIAGVKTKVANAAYTIGDLKRLRDRTKARRNAPPPEIRLVLYSKQLDGPIAPYFDYVDSVTFWTWDGADVASLKKNFAKYRSIVPSKPTYLGIYMWDFGGKQPIGMDFMRHQLDVALDLFRKGEIEGVVFHCTPLVNKNLDAVEYAKKWLNDHADEKFASAAAVKPTVRGVRNVRDFGAKISAMPAENAKAIQAAIDDAAAQGGGRVTVPAGTWKCGTLYLKSRVELHLDVGAVLKASSDLADYNGPDAFPGNYGAKDEGWNACHFIIANRCEDVAITGPGVINGSGETFFAGAAAPVAETYTWKDWRTVKDKQNGRPGQMLVFWECKNVRIENIFLHDTPSWACFLMGCDGVTVRDYRVRSGPLNPCTDGIDIDCCSNVLVERADIDVGDDAFAVRACAHRLGRDKPCENVTIRDCVIASTATDMRVGVGTGVIRNVTFENIVARRGGTSVIFNCFWGDPKKAGVDMENIVFRNVDFGAKWGPSFISGGDFQTFGIRNVLFDNCRFASGRGSIEDKGRFKTENIRYENCTFAKKGM